MLGVITGRSFSGNPRPLPNWKRFLDNCKIRMGVRHKQFLLASPQESGCVRLLRTVLFNVDTKYLLTQSDDYDRYTDVIQYATNLSNFFDPYHKQSYLLDTFYDNSKVSYKTKEYVISVNYNKPLNTLPLNISWKEWEAIPPVYILFYESKKLPRDLIGDDIKMTDSPEVSVISINLPLLILKWVSYVETHGEQSIQNPDPFIHTHVISHLHEQIYDLWVLNVLVGLVTGYENKDKKQLVNDYISDWIPKGTFDNCLDDIYSLVDRFSTTSIRISDILVSPFFPGNNTLTSFMNDLETKHVIPKLRQYDYIRFLCAFPYMELIVRLLRMQPDTDDRNYIFLYLQRSLLSYKRANMGSMAKGSGIKPYFDAKLQLLDDLIV